MQLLHIEYFMRKYTLYLSFLLLCSCGVYNQNIMFQTKESIIQNPEATNAALNSAEKNYLIQKNDNIEVRVYTNKGEVIIDPPLIGDNRIPPANIQNNVNQPLNGQAQGNNLVATDRFPLQYPAFLVKQDGFVNLPLVGQIKLEGLTIDEADSLLAIRYDNFYEDTYVRTRYTNKKVTVFKGTTGTIFPLRNEKINLIEVLAQTGGVPNNLRASNIRLIRGDLRSPDVKLINLRTMEGLMEHNLIVEPNDIIYVEPVRKTFVESLRDLSPFLTFVSSATTLLVLLINSFNN